MHLSRYRTALILAAPLLAPVAMRAQTLTSATVVGVVADSSGAVAPHVTVTITQDETGTVRRAVTGSAGDYRFPFLKPGSYTVSAEGAGLTATPMRIQLLVGQEQAVNLTLGVQAVNQTVEVNTTAELLQTENGNEVTTYGQQYVENTPVNGGDITNIAFTTPGLRLNVGGGNNNFNVSGLPFSAVLFTMNGADIVEPYNLNNKSGASNNTLGANDVSEAAVITNAYSAQYGREAGAQVNYISKSGTNQFHGNLVENYNGEFLNANDYFNKLNGTPRGKAVANQYAASVGGPILHDKLVFFANTEGLRYALPSSGVVSLPSTQFQTYVLAHVPAGSQPLYNSLFQLYAGAPGASRAVPVTTGTLPLQDSTGHLGCGSQGTFSGTYVNGTNGPRFGVDTPCANAFSTNTSSINTETFISGRVDYNISEKQKLYVRLSRDAGVQATATNPINAAFNTQSIQPWYVPQINYTYAITPRLVNNLILNGNYYSAIFGVANFPQSQALLPSDFKFSDGGANGGTFGGSSTASGAPVTGPTLPTGRRGQQLGIIDDLSWTIKRHTLQFGINDRANRISDSSIASGSIVGTYTFVDLADFSNGQVNGTGKGSTYVQSFPLLETVHTRLNSLDFYAQDEWQVRDNLTLTYGVRFEYQGNPPCKENCYSRPNTAFGASGYQAGAAVPYNVTLQTGLHNDFKNFEGVITEPRFAFAYSPLGKGKTVIRGGVGLFANTIAGSITASVFGNPPNKFTPTVKTGTVGTANVAGSAPSVAVASSNAFQSGFSQGDTLAQLNAAVPAGTTFATPTLYANPDTFHTIRVLMWGAELEQPFTVRDLVSFSYSGNHGYDEPLSNTAANAYSGAPTVYATGFGGLPTTAPDSRFSTVTQIFNAGISNYEGLTVTERHAMTRGLQGQVSYTWSHALALSTIYNPTLFTGDATPSGVALRSSGYGPTAFDTRHNLEADLLYTLPKLHPGWVNATAGGWTLGGKLYRYSGRPFSVTNSKLPTSLGAGSTNFGAGTVLADLLTAGALGTHCGKDAVRTPCLTASQFAAVATAATGGQRDFGNVEPNSFRGPGFFSIAAQLSKTVPIRDWAKFQIGGDAYNLLNHTNLAVPNSNVGGTGFGTITATVSSPTSIYGTGQGAIVSGRVLVVYGKILF